MASTESKRSIRIAQPSAPDSRTTKPNTRRSKTAGRRGGYNQRPFYRFEEVRGKTLDFVEFYTTGEFHCLDVRFEDKTSLSFVIDPGFTVETEHSDWNTGNWRPIKRWPLIHSEGFTLPPRPRRVSRR